GKDLQELDAVVRGANPDQGLSGLRRALLKVPVVGSLVFSLDGYFTSVRERVDEIMERLSSHRDQLVRDNIMYQGMRGGGSQKRHDPLVIAASGEIAPEAARKRLPDLQHEAEQAHDPEKSLAVQDFRDGIDRLDTQVTHLNEFAYAQLVAAPQLQIVT